MQKWWLSDRFSHVAVWVFYFFLAWSYFAAWIPLNKIPLNQTGIFFFTLCTVSLSVPFPYLATSLFRQGNAKHKYILYCTLALITIVSGSVGLAFVDGFFFPGELPFWFYTPIHLLGRVSTLFVLGLIVNWLIIRSHYYKQKREQAQLEKSKQEAELNMLKAQISPHFLFNTLNNLNSLIHTRPAEASRVVIRISQLLRYVIYEGQREQVFIADEVAYLENYIALVSMKQRLAERLKFHHEIHVNHPIEPLIFINFIENAIKHGRLEKDEDFINIQLIADKKGISFTCENTYSSTGNKDHMPGIGLKNIKERLGILYPEKHNLSIEMNAPYYRIYLTINA